MSAKRKPCVSIAALSIWCQTTGTRAGLPRETGHEKLGIKTMATNKGSLSHLAISGKTLSVRVTPGAARNLVSNSDGVLKITVTEVPEGGRATRAVTKALARVLGIAPSKLELIRGATARDKVFRIL